MKQRYRELTHELAVKAVLDCFDGKWNRNDVALTVEKYAGISRQSLRAELARNEMWLRLEAADAIAYELEQRIGDLLAGRADDLDLDPVIIRQRPDGMTGKIRDIALLSVMHQLVNHVVFLGLEPLLRARILPCQYASIPGRGQTGLARKAEKLLRSKRLGVAVIRKTDVHHAYGTTRYAAIIAMIRKEIPDAQWIIKTLEALARIAPHGVLIIGGYIDAWLFNLVMSYALRYVASEYRERRGKRMYLVVAVLGYMDDTALLGRREASVKSAAAKLDNWLRTRFGICLKPSNRGCKLLTVAEEHALRGSRRRPPGLDMGGYVVHRTYTSIRRAIYRRIRRAYLRAAWQFDRTGTVMLCRARKLISYNGYFKRTDTRKARQLLRVDELQAVARRVIAAHGARERRMNQCSTKM